MRNGFTTGSCAAAAAKAAAWMLFSGQEKNAISIMTPKGLEYNAQIEEITRGEHWVSCAVRKDGGDDPDITTGALVFAKVTGEEKESREAEILIDGGEGVGRVTRPGLDQPVGNAAINHVPREMITKEVKETAELFDYHGRLSVVISIPEGKKLALRTFNPRLGIEGGISVLGTSGVVEPMSAQALLDTIRAELSVLSSEGKKRCAISPGNYGQDYMQAAYGFDLDSAVKCSNFIGNTFEYLAEFGFTRVLACGHIGKFIKLYGGMFNTHSHEGDCRMELMASAALRAGASRETALSVLDQISTSAALKILKEDGVLIPVMEEVLRGVMDTLNRWAADRFSVECVIYENEFGELAKTPGAAALIAELTGREPKEPLINNALDSATQSALSRSDCDASMRSDLFPVPEQEKCSVISFTGKGFALGKRIAEGLTDTKVYIKSKAFTPEEGCLVRESLQSWAERRFSSHTPMVFIGALGIAVRAVAPFIENKLKDAPVVVCSEDGKYVIPVLSGHYGGAIELAKRIGALIGGECVVTTATDTRSLFAVDVFARENGLIIGEKDGIKKVSAKLLEEGHITLESVLSLAEEPPAEVGIAGSEEGFRDVLISFSPDSRPKKSYSLALIPKLLHAGIGCRKGIGKEELREALESVLREEKLDIRSIADISSIDVKAKEEGLIELAGELGLPFVTYSAAELSALEGDFSASSFVREQVGVDNVCERSAVLSAGGGELIVKKQKRSGITIAIAKAEKSLRFT